MGKKISHFTQRRNMGSSSSKTEEVIPGKAVLVTTVGTVGKVDARLTPQSFLLVDCDNKLVVIDDEVLNSIASSYGTNLSTYPDFRSKCSALHRSIKDDQQRKLKEQIEARPPLSIDSFRRAQCSELSSSYTIDEWNIFYNQSKDQFPDLTVGGMLQGNIPMKSQWDVPVVCSQMRSSLIRRRRLPEEVLTEEEKLALIAIDQQIARGVEKQRQRKIDESVAITERLIRESKAPIQLPY
jgi:hypothetical protein